jgi:hypothetical protein
MAKQRRSDWLEDKLIELFLVAGIVPLCLCLDRLPAGFIPRKWETYFIGGTVILYFAVMAPAAWWTIRKLRSLVSRRMRE